MNTREELQARVLNLANEDFEELAIDVFHYQYTHNKVYKLFVDYLDLDISRIDNLKQIPFLPIDFFKQHQVVSTFSKKFTLFESSGTTGSIPSKHYVADTQFYKNLSVKLFENTYGKLEDFIILALLPSYLERNTSSLVYMVKHFIKKTNHTNSGFYLHNTAELLKKLDSLRSSGKKILLIGVTFALLDLPETDLSHVMVMETGGMKGRKKELLRPEVHALLQKKFNLKNIHSEYGMTELLSQAYSQENGVFNMPTSMQILIREPQDPFNLDYTRGGGINIADLGNIDSCSFIATQDLGEINENEFTIIGRIDHSDLRGCNLMVV